MSDGVIRSRLSFSGSETKTISIPASNFANVVYIDGSAPAQRTIIVKVGNDVAWAGYFSDVPFRQNLSSNGVGTGLKGDPITVICSGSAEIFIGYKLYT